MSQYVSNLKINQTIQHRSNCRINISRNGLFDNLAYVKKCAGNTQIIAVLKANAYGLGAVAIASCLEQQGVRHWAVNDNAEADELRQAGIAGQIFLLGHLDKRHSAFEFASKNQLIISLNSVEDVYSAKSWCKKTKYELKSQIQVDIGMKRLGVSFEELDNVKKIVGKQQFLKIIGVYGHPASSTVIELNREHNRLLEMLNRWKEPRLSVFSHFASSKALELRVGLESHAFARIGIALFGGLSNFGERHVGGIDRGVVAENDGCSPKDNQKKWKTVVSISAPIVQIHRLEPGDSVSYDSQFCAVRASTVAVIPVGYADGISSCLSNQLKVIVRNNQVNQVGKITMNYMMIDVTNIESVRIGDVATIGSERQPFNELAKLSNSLPYEMFTRLSPSAVRHLI